ncbi:MAG: MATE family efflux transporter [Pseudomonadota bacterium]
MTDARLGREATRGGGAITHRRVLGIALPIVVSNATVPILGIVDTGVVGQLGEAAPIAAVGMGALILSSLYWVFGFLRMGTVGLTSQALGAGDREEADAHLTRALAIGGLVGLALILLQIPLFRAAFWVTQPSAEVSPLAGAYLGIRIWSAPALIAGYAVIGWLIAAERTRAILAVQIAMNGLNIVLDLIFVIGLGWGVPGVAWATFIAEWSGLGFGLWLCRDAFGRPGWRDWQRIFAPHRLAELAVLNGNLFLRTAILETMFIFFVRTGSALGDVTLAANTILMQFLYVTTHALDGFANAAETLVGQAMGARDRARLRRSAVLTGTWGAGMVFALAILFLLAGPLGIDAMTTAENVRIEAKSFLIWMVLAPFSGVAAWMFDGIYVGATRTRQMRNSMIVAASVYAVGIFTLVPAFGNHGLWASLLLSFVTRGVTLGAWYPQLERAAAGR